MEEGWRRRCGSREVGGGEVEEIERKEGKVEEAWRERHDREVGGVYKGVEEREVGSGMDSGGVEE